MRCPLKNSIPSLLFEPSFFVIVDGFSAHLLNFLYSYINRFVLGLLKKSFNHTIRDNVYTFPLILKYDKLPPENVSETAFFT